MAKPSISCFSQKEYFQCIKYTLTYYGLTQDNQLFHSESLDRPDCQLPNSSRLDYDIFRLHLAQPIVVSFKDSAYLPVRIVDSLVNRLHPYRINHRPDGLCSRGVQDIKK